MAVTSIKRNKRFRKKHPAAILLAVAAALGCCAALLLWGSDRMMRASYPMKYSDLVQQYSSENDLPPELVYAIIRCESSFDPNAVSSVGARGLMQLMEPSFDWVKNSWQQSDDATFDDLYDPETNIRYGCRLFALLMQEYGTERNALCAYHAGWGTARQWLDNREYAPDGKNIENIPYADMAYYVDKVINTAKIYKKLYDL